jgi:hypothetical protein
VAISVSCAEEEHHDSRRAASGFAGVRDKLQNSGKPLLAYERERALMLGAWCSRTSTIEN